jgi:MFS family permease
MDSRNKLFVASCVALIATAMTFAIRGDILTDLETVFALSKAELGWITGAAFWSFGLFIFFGGPLVDYLGMGRLLRLAVACHIGGALMTIFAPNFAILFLATFVVGAGNGLVEAVCNPLVATLYPEEKTRRLTLFHAWFPGGIVIGGLLAFFLSRIGTAYIPGESVATLAGISLWKIKMGTLLIPSLIYLSMIWRERFPQTERVAAGLPFREMIYEAFRRPLFIVIFFMMWFTASTELVPGGFIKNVYDDLMGDTRGAGILFLVWGSGLMWALRQFFSKQAHSISPVLLITITAPLAALGLFMYPYAQDSTVLFFIATTLLYVGVCFWWPTMLGIANERCPKTGALGLAIIGGTGSIATAVGGPVFGGIIDRFRETLLTSEVVIRQAAERVLEVETVAATMAGVRTLQVWAILPAVLFVVFLVIHIRDLQAGGYRVERLEALREAGEPAIAPEEPTAIDKDEPEVTPQ